MSKMVLLTFKVHVFIFKVFVRILQMASIERWQTKISYFQDKTAVHHTVG